MPHTNGATRQTLSPNQLTLIEATNGWRNQSPRAQRQRDRDRKRAEERIINRLRFENNEAVKQHDQLRQQIAAQTELLNAIRNAQNKILAEIAALAKEKPMAIDELADELHFLIGTDHPFKLAERLGYTDIENLTYRLRRNGLKHLAEQLKRPLKKPPAPYPSHQWRTRKPTPNKGQE